MSTESELELIFKILEEPNYTFLIFRWFKIEMPGTMSKFCKSIVCYVSWLKWFSELEWPIALFQRFTSLPLAGPTLVKTYQKAWNLTNTIRFQHHSNQPMGSLKFYKAWTLYHTTIWGLKQKLSIRTFRLHWAQKDVKTHHMEKKKKNVTRGCPPLYTVQTITGRFEAMHQAPLAKKVNCQGWIAIDESTMTMAGEGAFTGVFGGITWPETTALR